MKHGNFGSGGNSNNWSDDTRPHGGPTGWKHFLSKGGGRMSFNKGGVRSAGEPCIPHVQFFGMQGISSLQ
jgi:hypothetical protein